jgi:PAS domain S-box-containing protein
MRLGLPRGQPTLIVRRHPAKTEAVLQQQAAFPVPPFLVAAGEMPARIADFDWSSTPLGPISTWPECLRTTIGIVVRSSVPMVLLWGPSGIMIYNDAYSVFAGGHHPKLLGSKVLEGWPEVADFNANVLKLGLAGETLAFKDQELTLHRHGGAEQVWMNLDYAPVLDAGDKPAGVIAIVVETTQRVLADRRVLAEQQRQRQLLQQMPGFIGVVSGPEHIYEYVNDAYVKISERTGFIGRRFRDVFADLADQSFAELLDRVYATGESVVMRGMELRLHGSPDSQYIDFLFEAIRDAAGHVTGVFIGGYEITESYRAVEGLRSSEGRLRLVVDGAKDHAILTTDPAGVITTWSPGAESIFGWTETEIIGQSSSLLFLPEDAAAGADRHELTRAASEGCASDERWHLRKDGSRVFMNGSVHPLPPSKHGRAQGFLKIARDETNRRRAEARRAALVRLTDALHALDDENEIGFAAAEILGETLEVSRVGYGTINPDAETLHVVRDWCAAGTETLAGGDLRLRDYGSFVESLKRGALISISDVREDSRTAQAAASLEHRHARSFVNVPLVEKERLVAVLYINHREVRDWSREDLSFIREVAERTRTAAARLRSEAALRESEMRLAVATEAAEIGVWEWDLATNAMMYSARAREISGFLADAPLSLEDVGRIVHPEDYSRTSEMARRALDPAIRERLPYEYRVIWPDGAVRWVIAHGKAVFSDDSPSAKALHYIGTLQDVTERRRLEEATRESAQRLRLAVDAGRMAVWEADLVHGTMTHTTELNRILGYADDATPSMDEIREGYAPGERERVQAIGQAALARGEPFIEAEYRYIRPDGQPRWLLLRCEILMNAAGAPARAVGVLSDVTARRESEEALRTSEMRLQLAHEAAGAAVWDWDVRSGRVEWAPEVFRLHAIDPLTPSETLFDAWENAVHPNDRAMARTTADLAGTQGTPFSMDYRVPLGATVRWVRSQAIVLNGADGRPSRVTGINLDVTDQHREEERLRTRADRLETAVEQRTRERDRIYELSNDLFAVVGFDGWLKTVNPAWSRLLGYSEADLLSRPFISFADPADRSSAMEVVKMLQSGEVIRGFEGLLVGADGRLHCVSWSAVPEGDAYYVVGRDVTREKERDEALRQSQKMEAVGQLTGGIAHDFNNLLQAVHGNLDLIRRRADDDRIRKWATQGLQAAERGEKLTAQLLAFSRAQKLELVPVDAPKLVAGMSDMLARTLGPAVRIRMDLAQDGTAVLADPTQLEMAVLNLAINARDAMPEGGDLIIRTRRSRIAQDPEAPPGDYLLLEVSDSGPGMPPDVLRRAFDPFFTTKGVGKGTGLGLSQVYGMARQAGGTARITTKAGKGTTVTLLLRCTESAVADQPRDGSSGDIGKGPSATVLVVDDDPDVRRFIADTLDALGYIVMEAENGFAGLAALERSTPDVLLVDFAMPGMNGAEMARAALDKSPGLKVVFASGYSDTDAISTAVGAEVSMLRKPFRIEELESMVAAVLDQA